MSAQVVLECLLDLFVILLDKAGKLEELFTTVAQWKRASFFERLSQPLVNLRSFGQSLYPTLRRGQTC